MEGMHVLLFVEFTKDFKKTSMIVKKISKELVDHGHDVTVVGKVSFKKFIKTSVLNSSKIQSKILEIMFHVRLIFCQTFFSTKNLEILYCLHVEGSHSNFC